MDVHVYHHSGKGCGIAGIAILAFGTWAFINYPGWTMLVVIGGFILMGMFSGKK
jgi:hypothetical protein